MTLAVYARRGARYARESAAGPIGTGMLLGMLGLAIVWLAQLPVRARRASGGSAATTSPRSGYLECVFGDWLALGGTFVAICLALLVVMALARLARRAGGGSRAPRCSPRSRRRSRFVGPVPHPRARAARRSPSSCAPYERFERAQGVDDIPLRIEEVSGDTSQANAYAFGIGPSRRSSSGTRCSTAGSPTARCTSSSPTRSGTTRATTCPRRSRGSRSSRCPAPAPDARDPAPRRHGRARGGAARAARRGGAPARRGAGRRTSISRAWRRRPTGRRSRRRATPPSARGLFRRVLRDVARRPEPADVGTSCSQTHPTLAQRVAMAEAWAARQHQQVSD